ncbi:hypothetical protein BDB01DRAFT_840111 [Pilobolus umbonatus]|nr:hypothetical protein BDB01DRAFT_840111 [Pilobolus umbonatus]
MLQCQLLGGQLKTWIISNRFEAVTFKCFFFVTPLHCISNRVQYTVQDYVIIKDSGDGVNIRVRDDCMEETGILSFYSLSYEWKIQSTDQSNMDKYIHDTGEANCSYGNKHCLYGYKKYTFRSVMVTDYVMGIINGCFEDQHIVSGKIGNGYIECGCMNEPMDIIMVGKTNPKRRLEKGEVPIERCDSCDEEGHSSALNPNCANFNPVCPSYGRSDHRQTILRTQSRWLPELNTFNMLKDITLAMMWLEEKSTNNSRSPVFHICCGKGKYICKRHSSTPTEIAKLLIGNDARSTEFKSNIRAYNSALSFTSMGCVSHSKYSVCIPLKILLNTTLQVISKYPTSTLQ